MSFGFSIGDFVAVLQLANNIRKQFVDAPTQFRAIFEEVKSLSIVLQDIDDILPGRDFTRQQQTELCNVVKHCQSVLKELDKILNKFKELDPTAKSTDGKPRRVWKRFRWDQKDIDELRSRILSNILLLNTFLGRVSSQAVFEIKDGVERLHERQDTQERQQETRERQQEHETILNWITPIDYAAQQHDFISRRQAGTGQWLLQSAEFQRWLETDKQTLFCPGIPGAGKTILTAVTINDLTTRFQNDPGIGIAYLYCNFRRKDEQKAQDLLASLLKQLSEGRSSLLESVQSLYHQHKEKQTRPSLDEILKTLQSVASIYSRVIIIIDALDECQVSDGCRAIFLKEIFRLLTTSRVNLFITSRFIPEITERFKGSITLEIRAQNEDVRRYLDGRILLSGKKLLETHHEEIKTEITKVVDGMFLLAQLHFEAISTKKTLKKMKDALKILPTGPKAYDYAYDEAMKRIAGYDKDSEELAKQVLLWITCAKRPLTTMELQHALGVEVSESKLNEENLPQFEDIVSVCAGLVTIDEESEIVRLVHFTTQEYFERTQRHWFPNAHTNITIICVSYLSFDQFKSGICQSDSEFEQRLQSHKLYNYAARNWGHHAREASTLCRGVVEFLQKPVLVGASSQALLAEKLFSSRIQYSQIIPKQMTGLHLAAYFGVNNVLQLLIGSTNVDLKDSYGKTPLSYAASRGYEATVQLLLQYKADVDLKDVYRRTPLSYAAENGHVGIVKLLLATEKVDADSKDESGRTPLSYAAESGHDGVVVLLLLQKTINADTQDNHGNTPLSYAAWMGCESVAQLLLAHESVNADSRDMDGDTPLLSATFKGYRDVVKLLITSGKVDLSAKNNAGQTPLSLAAERGDNTVVQLLLDTGKVDADLRDDNGQTPLLCATENGHETIVRQMLERGANIDIESKSGWTALQLASLNRHEGIEQLLLIYGAAEPEDFYGLQKLFL